MGLHAKMHAIMMESEAIEKNLSVGFGSNSYKAVSEASVLNAIKPLLKKHKVILFPVKIEVKDMVDSFNTSKGESVRLMTQVKAQYKIVDVETGEFEILESIGNGVDTQDKASGKAMTYAYKALFQKTFCLFSGEDTDNEHSDDITERNTNEISRTGLSDAQVKRLYAIAKKAGFDTPKVKEHILIKYKKTSVSDLTKAEYDKAVTGYEAMIK